MRRNLPPRIFTAEFWHAHFNYAALRTDPALAAIGSMDGLAGDQICQWNSVAPDSILPATHLSVFIPPPLGASVLANHQSHEFFFLARCCLGQVPGGAPFSQRSEQATACTNRMQIRN